MRQHASLPNVRAQATKVAQRHRQRQKDQQQQQQQQQEAPPSQPAKQSPAGFVRPTPPQQRRQPMLPVEQALGEACVTQAEAALVRFGDLRRHLWLVWELQAAAAGSESGGKSRLGAQQRLQLYVTLVAGWHELEAAQEERAYVGKNVRAYEMRHFEFQVCLILCARCSSPACS